MRRLTAVFISLLIILIILALIATPFPADADNPDNYDHLALKVDDLDGDGVMEEYCLSEGILTVKKDGRNLLETPPDWQVEYFSLGDVNNDGNTELVFSLWKKGSFGKIRPFWHTGDNDSYKNHLFVYKLEEDIFKPVWCSSDLDRPILSIDILDINDDGLYELVVNEGQYQQPASFRPFTNITQTLTAWQWNQWGFYKLD
jgi:poly-gamma-glutamate synthesis protein (capsule biosynthesis protein)